MAKPERFSMPDFKLLGKPVRLALRWMGKDEAPEVDCIAERSWAVPRCCGGSPIPPRSFRCTAKLGRWSWKTAAFSLERDCSLAGAGPCFFSFFSAFPFIFLPFIPQFWRNLLLRLSSCSLGFHCRFSLSDHQVIYLPLLYDFLQGHFKGLPFLLAWIAKCQFGLGFSLFPCPLVFVHVQDRVDMKDA